MPQFRIGLRPEMGKGPEDVGPGLGRQGRGAGRGSCSQSPAPGQKGGGQGARVGGGGNEVPSGDQRMTEMGPEGGAGVGTLQKQGSLGKGGPAWVSSNRGERTVP